MTSKARWLITQDNLEQITYDHLTQCAQRFALVFWNRNGRMYNVKTIECLVNRPNRFQIARTTKACSWNFHCNEITKNYV